ncbi:hypothetical protein LWI28_026022 [Acer negundo]|uniref:Uncharacterized protein n=1 Tax=Acer negundo TaxID=4023 RepID=A0AAD5P358_ACENE|nr:hypothetical protein LWI28_026022 [Acer negundo]
MWVEVASVWTGVTGVVPGWVRAGGCLSVGWGCVAMGGGYGDYGGCLGVGKVYKGCLGVGGGYWGCLRVGEGWDGLGCLGVGEGCGERLGAGEGCLGVGGGYWVVSGWVRVTRGVLVWVGVVLVWAGATKAFSGWARVTEGVSVLVGVTTTILVWVGLSWFRRGLLGFLFVGEGCEACLGVDGCYLDLGGGYWGCLGMGGSLSVVCIETLIGCLESICR